MVSIAQLNYWSIIIHVKKIQLRLWLNYYLFRRRKRLLLFYLLLLGSLNLLWLLVLWRNIIPKIILFASSSISYSWRCTLSCRRLIKIAKIIKIKSFMLILFTFIFEFTPCILVDCCWCWFLFWFDILWKLIWKVSKRIRFALLLRLLLFLTLWFRFVVVI